MAISSKNKPLPKERPVIMSADQAIGVLDSFHHWSCTKINFGVGNYRYLVRITHAGYRVEASRSTWIDAVDATISKLFNREKKPLNSHGLKLVK